MFRTLQALFDKYMPLVIKMKFKLYHMAKDYRLKVEIEGYEQEAFFRFISAVRTCRLKDLHAREDPNWCFYIVFWGYLSSYNRTTIGHARKDKRHTESEYVTFDDGDEVSKIDRNEARHRRSIEETYLENVQKSLFWETVDACVKDEFNECQAKIWNMKERGAKVLAISRAVKLPQKHVKEELIKMRKVFKHVLYKKSAEKKIDSDVLKAMMENDALL